MSLKMMPSVTVQPGIDIDGNVVYQGERLLVSPLETSSAGRAVGGRLTLGQGKREEISDAEAERRIKNAIDQANERVKQQNGYRRLAFSYNKETKKISIKVYDEITKEIIREIPPEKADVILDKVHDLAGIVVDEKR
ncbi:FlaG protein [Catonella morbi ATCC 51271]|uniref:FlaG protein n=1 Tax=Catonella morbi ATCC 51271 TaxID=592026 RepID=V2Z3V9_9FIRM|nr:flagellar protein FlaG [Catonella morbi]ESL01595.1 FlaG protein [Catonella morbi ATCC 51271]